MYKSFKVFNGDELERVLNDQYKLGYELVQVIYLPSAGHRYRVVLKQRN